jgi:hypothetical protein
LSEKLHNEELHNLYFSPSIIIMIKSKRMRWAGNLARIGMRNAYSIFVGKPEEKGTVGRAGCRWVDNIKMYLTEVGRGGMQ